MLLLHRSLTNRRSSFLDECEMDTAADLPTLMDFLAETLFTMSPASLETAVSDGTRALKAVKHLNEVFSIDPDKLYRDCEGMLETAPITKAGNIALGLIFKLRDKPVKLKRLLKTHATDTFASVWSHAHNHVQVAVESFVPTTPASKKAKAAGAGEGGPF